MIGLVWSSLVLHLIKIFFQGHIGIVEILVVAGGDASLRNSEKKTALKLAKDKRQTHVVHYLRGVEKEQSKLCVQQTRKAH